jgi:hypothetical protein
MKTRRPNDATLAQCAFHAAVLTECVNALAAEKAFNKDKIIGKLHYEGIASAIHWDYIRRRIEQGIAESGNATELLPLAAAFFKRHRASGDSINSLLAGPGGKSAGFALATIEDGKIALATVQLRVNQQEGARKAIRNRADNLAETLATENQGIASQIRQIAGIQKLSGKGVAG